MTVAHTPPRWRLDQLYTGLDDRAFGSDEERLTTDLARATEWFDENDIGEGGPGIATDGVAAQAATALDHLNRLTVTQRRIRAFVHARTTTDTRDDDASAALSRLLPLSGDLMRLHGRFAAWIARFDDLADASADASVEEVLTDHGEFIRQCNVSAGHRMSDVEEDLALALGLTGGSAWVRMRNDVAGRMTADVAGFDEPVPLGVVRGLATHPEADVRDAALVGEQDMWERNAVPFAAALNAHKGESITLNDRRGWSDDLAPVLAENGIDEAVLDAMTKSVVESLPSFRRFCQVKAELLGRDGGLPWSDLVAPLATASGDDLTWDDALATVVTSFGSYATDLRRLAERAIEEDWIDAEPRNGKQIGAYCMPVEGDVSRILMNFDGSADSVQTLAHELGHAFHNSNLAVRTEMQRRTPRSLAETASIFCETIVIEALLEAADPAAELAILNTDLSGSTQVVVDIHSRFLFESELYRRRRSTTLSIQELNELMTECQDIAYGDGLADGSRHPYMWAVKPHYFTPFYNFPYTFGLLFGLGLFTRFQDDPGTFRAGYNDLLSSTGMAPPTELAARFDIDLADGAFWTASLDLLARRIDRFEELAHENLAS